jgi:hypothetical protein
VGGHEIDRVRSDLFSGHAQVALVFAVLVIHQNDHTAASNLVDRFFNRG